MIRSILAQALILTVAIAAGNSFAQSIQGTVTVAPELEKKVTAHAVLYVIARSGDAQSGPPLAVVRISKPKFPQAFEIGPKNIMAKGEFKGPLQIAAKLSKSGDPMTASGDLLGKHDKPASPGDKGVEVVLNKDTP